MKIVTIIGARPQFIKASALSREIAKRSTVEEVIVHTGQHFDENMSSLFFDQMNIPKPTYLLGINQLSHGAMTGRMIEQIEEILLKESPDFVVVYGDTNSTLAGALAAKKLNFGIAHIEAGLRSFNNAMPEETNRILTDRISDFLFCPTDNSIENLIKEGFEEFDCQIVRSGDIMLDVMLGLSAYAQKPLFFVPEEFILSTIHRQENTSDPFRMNSIINALATIAENQNVILPMHPATKSKISQYHISTGKITVVEPIGFLEMMYMLQRCQLVVTDSGGVQKEAFFHQKPCVTVRDETEWVELQQLGYNYIAGTEEKDICKAIHVMMEATPDYSVKLYGSGNAASIILDTLESDFNSREKI